MKLSLIRFKLCKDKMRETPTLHCEVNLWPVATAHREVRHADMGG